MEHKTARMLRYGDKLYHPTIDKIVEYGFDLIKESKEQIHIKFNDYSADSNWFNVNKNTTTIQDESGGRKYYINREKAKLVQRGLQTKELERLQKIASISLLKLNEFASKYF